MVSTHLLALTFLRLGEGPGSIFHALSFIIKAQCSSDIYSTGERELKGEGEKTPPLSSTSLFFIQRDIWEEVTGSCDQGTFCSGTSSRGTVVTLSK